MNRAMYSGLSGTSAHQVKMDVAANNLANVSTVGFKASTVSFQDAYYQTLRASRPAGNGVSGTSGIEVGTGVRVGAVATLSSQGTIQSSGQNLDAAIDGNGMFVVATPSGLMYTREGICQMDAQNKLVMASTGYAMQGWLGAAGTVNTTGAAGDLIFALGTMRSPRITSSVKLQGNLDAGRAVGDTYASSISVFDSLGAAHDLEFVFAKTGSGTWDVTATCEGTSTTNNLVFDANGALTAGGAVNLTAPMPGGAANLTLAIDLAQTTQYAGASDAMPTGQDGFGAATLFGVAITDGGVVMGNYSDGRAAALGQLALATFANMDGLEQTGSNLYMSGPASGLPQLGPAETGGRGQVVGQSVEMSNADLTDSFLEMLVTQRAYQANSRVISTADSLLEETLRLAR